MKITRRQLKRIIYQTLNEGEPYSLPAAIQKKLDNPGDPLTGEAKIDKEGYVIGFEHAGWNVEKLGRYDKDNKKMVAPAAKPSS